MRLAKLGGVLSLMIGAALPVMAADLPAASKITAATVYSDSAVVTREAVVDVPAGASTIVFDNLPAGLDANSLRAEGSAEAAVTLGAVESKIINQAELVQPRMRDLNGKLQLLEDQKALLEADDKADDARASFYGNLGKQAGALADTDFEHLDLNPGQWAQASDSLYAGISLVGRSQVARSIAVRALDQQLEALRAELASIGSEARSSARVAVPIEASAATRLSMKVSYLVQGARWTPLYDARLDTASGKLELTEFGKVAQTTGEDWTDVALTLSTATPSAKAGPPALVSLWVTLQAPPPAPMAAEPFQGNALYSVSQMPSGVPVKEKFPTAAIDRAAEFKAADVRSGGFVAEYGIPGTATVLADGAEHRVMVQTLSTTASLLERIEPAKDIHAYLSAKAKLTGDSPALPGEAKLFRDGIFIGSAPMPLLQPGEETTLPFGLDPQLTVKRQATVDTAGKDGFIRSEQTLLRKLTTTVHNLHHAPVQVEVLETLPVSRDESIKVEILDDDTTAGFEKDADKITGLARWKVTIPPAADASIKLGWRITWPAAEQIYGLQ